MDALHIKGFSLALCLAISSFLFSQNIAMNLSGTPGNSSAILDLSDPSNYHLGVLFTNVYLTSPASYAPLISVPPNGLIVWNTNSNTLQMPQGIGFYYWTNSPAQWNNLYNISNPVTGSAEYIQENNVNGSVPPATAFIIDTLVLNTSGSGVTASAGNGGSVFELVKGVYSIGYEMSLSSAGSVALYTGSSIASLIVDNNTITGSSTATTWIHGSSIENVTTTPFYFEVSSVVGTASVVTAGTAAGFYTIRLTINKIN